MSSRIRFGHLSGILALLFTATSTSAQEARPFTLTEKNVHFSKLADAVAAVGDGSGTILIAAGTYRQCAVQSAGAIIYRAAQPGKVIFDGATCEGKAALVLRGHSATIEGLTFRNLRVPDRNGAGIRLEKGRLSVADSVFSESEEGILANDEPHGTVSIARSTFRRLGRCGGDMDCAHSIYVGRYGKLIVKNSRFEAGTGGHYVKSRAANVEITGNSFDDSAGHATNYMIDLSNGSSGVITDNAMVQGRDKDNYSAFITIAPEGRENDSSALAIRDNQASFVPGLVRTSDFVANWTGDTPQISGNRLAKGIRQSDRR